MSNHSKFQSLSKSIVNLYQIDNKKNICSLNNNKIILGNYINNNLYLSYDANFINSRFVPIIPDNLTNINIDNRFSIIDYSYIKRLYLRLNTDLLINIVISNRNRDENNNIILPIETIFQKENAKNFLRFYENNITNKSERNNFLDITNYNQYMYSVTSISRTNSIVEEGLYRNFVELEPLANNVTYSKHTSDTRTISGFQNLGNNYTTPNDGLFNIISYPVYELQIDNAKYNETSLRKYFNKNLSNINQKIYDYKKGIYVDDVNKNTHSELLKISGHNNPSGFDIIFNKSIGSVSIKHFMKIFEVNKKSLDINSKYVFYNNGLPYMYFKIPEVSLPNNSIIQIQGSSSLDNIPSTEINGQKKLLIPNKYRVTLRQLAPLPQASFIDNDKYLFQNQGYSRVEDGYINNEYQEYINNSISKTRVKDIAANYININIRKIKERIHSNNYFSLTNISKLDKIFNFIEKNANSSNQHKYNLKKTYVNNFGQSVQMSEVKNYDNLGNISTSTSNKNPYEYFGQALINCSDNGLTYRQTQFLDDEKNKLSGIESAFFENELFMRISDINSSYKKTIIGRITHLAKTADKNGNHTIDYDLFVEELNNFKIGDIIIGLDSGTIGVILPNEYQFSSLPNDDIISLGIANYYLNLNSGNKTNELVSYFLSISNTINNTRDLTLDFINNYQYWLPERIHTSNGFYIKLDSVPNNSRLTGILTSRLQVLIPHNFKFLEGSDTPLESLGFVDSIANNEFNYFKDNFTNAFETEIKWSYIINHNEDIKQYLIVETKNTDNFAIEDVVYIKNHEITLKDVDYRKELYFNTLDIIPFSAYLSKFEEVYNNFILEKIGDTYFNNMNNAELISIMNQLNNNASVTISTKKYNSNLNYFNDDLSSIDCNYIDNVIVDGTNNSVDLFYYTDNQGKITNTYLTGITNLSSSLNKNIVLNSEYGNKIDLKLIDNSISLEIDNKILNSDEVDPKKDADNFGFGLSRTPFKNKFLGINLHQNNSNYTQSYNLRFTRKQDVFDNSTGHHFMINYIDNNIEKILVKNEANSSDYNNILSKYIYEDTSNGVERIKSEYKNQVVSLTFTDSDDITKKFVLKEIIQIKDSNTLEKVLMVEPGNYYYSKFQFIEGRDYLVQITVNRTFTAFSDFNESASLDNNLDVSNIKLHVAGGEFDNVFIGSVGLTDYSTNTDYINASTYISNISDINLSFAGGVNLLGTGDDNVIINSIVREDLYQSNKFEPTFDLGKHIYTFDLSIENKNLSNLTGNLELKKISDNSTLKTVSSNNYKLETTYNNIYKAHLEPLSIYNKVIESYLTNKEYHSLLKSSKIFTKYYKNTYSSRIIKIKMSPIDNKGFSIENNIIKLNEPNYNSVYGPTRAVPGYKKLLFPYHEYSIISDYKSAIDGQPYKVGSEILKRYSRVKQKLNNESYSTRNFLPGMGIYTISESIEPTEIIGDNDINGNDNIRPYNSLGDSESIENIRLTNTVYTYKTKFIGYVLNTSIESIEEDSASYRLNSENFSKNGSDDLKTEYYVYVLIDPNATSNNDIDDIFNELNRDDVHYVHDGSANKQYTKTEPLVSPGILTSGNKYLVEYNTSLNKYILKGIDKNTNTDAYFRVGLNQVLASNAKNIYGTRAILGNAGEIKFYDNDNLNYFLEQPTFSGTNHAFDIFDTDTGGTAVNKNNYKYIDILQENLFGCITIIKDKLDNTLPNFTYSKRIACGTHTERPVFYKKSNNTMRKRYNKLADKLDYDEKLFMDGSLDLYFQEILKNKAVLHYEPILDNKTYKNLNSKNIIIEDNINVNNRLNNNHEINQHANTLKNYTSDDFDYKNKRVNAKIVKGVSPEYTFEPRTDLVLINNARKEYLYDEGPNYNTFLGKPGNDTKNQNTFKEFGYNNYPIKVMTGRLLPQVDFENIQYSILEEYRDLTKNWAMLDVKYDEHLNLLGSYKTFGKYKTTRYDIVGNNYEQYNSNNIVNTSNTNNGIYNEVVFVEEIGNFTDENNNTRGYMIAHYNITNFEKGGDGNYISQVTVPVDNINLTQIPILKDKMFILSGYLQDSVGSEPFNIPYNSELCIIEDATVYQPNENFFIKTINNEFNVSLEKRVFLEKVILFKFKNRINKNHKSHREEQLEYNSLSSKFYILNQIFNSTSELEKVDINTSDSIFEAANSGDKIYSYLKKQSHYEDEDFYRIDMTCNCFQQLKINNCFKDMTDTFIFDYGKRRRIEFRDTPPPYSINNNYEVIPTSSFLKSVFISTGTNKITVYFANNIDSSIPIFYPVNTNIVLLKNTLIRYPDNKDDYISLHTDKLSRNNASTKPFIHNGEWFTKIYFNSSNNNDKTLYSSLGKEKYIINDYDHEKVISSNKNIYSTTDMFIHSMKGLRIPFICLEIDDYNNFNDEYHEPQFLGPIENDHYETYIKNLINDFANNKLIQDYQSFEGEFVHTLTSHLEDHNWSWRHIPGKHNINFDYFIVKGLYNGFGGICEERFESNFINNSVNNDMPARIARIKNLNNKFFLFIELDTFNSPLIFNKSQDIETTYTINQSGRTDSLDYETYLNLLENSLSKLDTTTMNKLTKFGKGGTVSKKKIENPYNLNPNNYVYLVIPVFDNIELIQNNSLQGAFAKILLPGESNKTLFNTYTSASKIFTHNLYNNLSEIEIAFITNDGFLFDFNGAEHSFSLEITEVIDKFEHINPKFGNIEF